MEKTKLDVINQTIRALQELNSPIPEELMKQKEKEEELLVLQRIDSAQELLAAKTLSKLIGVKRKVDVLIHYDIVKGVVVKSMVK